MPCRWAWVEVRVDTRKYRVGAWLGPALIGLGMAVAVSDSLARQPSKEAQLKAAYVFNFVRYTEWPESAFESMDAPLRLCAFSLESDVGLALAALSDNPVRNRRVQVVAVRTQDNLQDCHLVYFENDVGYSPSLPGSAESALPQLTVGEAPTFASRGGVIGLVIRGKRLAFEVNLEAAKRAQLRLSSQMLALAQIVKDG